ncbi:thioredoxin family protein [Bacteroidota bacterium]
MLFFKTLQIGDRLKNFSLKGIDGMIHSLEDYSTKKALIVIFVSNNSKHSQAYESRMVMLQNIFRSKGVQLLAINSNDTKYSVHDTLFHMIDQARKARFNFPYLKDSSQNVAKYFDAVCTPEAFVFDEDKKLIYRGRIDDNWSNPLSVKVNYVAKALRQMFDGKPITLRETPPQGETIKWHY